MEEPTGLPTEPPRALPADTPAPVATCRAAPPHPRIWPVFAALAAALLLAFVLQCGTGFVLAVTHGVGAALGGKAVNRFDYEQLLASPLGFVLIASGSQAAFLIVALVAVRDARERAATQLGLGPAPFRWSGYAACLLGGLAVAWLGGVAAAVTADWSAPEVDVNAMRAELGWLSGTLFVLFIGLAPGFVEELFFRGYVQRRLLLRWPPAVAIGVTSLLFALSHLDLTTVAMALPIGVWLGVLAWRTGSIRPCIACHMAINMIWNVYFTLLAKGGVSELAEGLSLLFMWLAAGLGLFAAVRLLVRLPSPAVVVELDEARSGLENCQSGLGAVPLDPGV